MIVDLGTYVHYNCVWLRLEMLSFLLLISGQISTSELKKVLENLSDEFPEEINFDNMIKSADPSNKGTVSFTKLVMVVEINKKQEEIELFNPKGNTKSRPNVTLWRFKLNICSFCRSIFFD